MKILGVERALTQSEFDAIAVLMDDVKREKIHSLFAPCTPEEFLLEYMLIDPDFEDLLYDEFGIE